VFVDQSGRRGRILTVTAIGSGAAVVALLAFVVTEMLGGTQLPGLGWPGKAPDRPAVESTASQSPADSSSWAPRVSPSVTTVPQTPVPTSPSRPPQQTPGTASPTGRPSRTPPPATQEPVAGNPGHGGTPPGLVEKTQSPK
jgi:hypothetical protein